MLTYFSIGAITAMIALWDIPIDPFNRDMYLFAFTGIAVLWPVLALLAALQIILTLLYNLFSKNPIDL